MDSEVRRWRRRLVVALVALACLVPAHAGAQIPDSLRTAQAAAMQRLDYMVGTWRGEGWIDYGGRRLTFRGSEQVQRKLDGLALLVEGNFLGRAPGAEREVPVHTTLAVISYAPATRRYQFDTWLASGAQGEHELLLADDGWQWEIRQPAGRIRYVMRLTPEGEWLETGERSADGTAWRQFFEMRLRK
jgi:hypothetical protein